MIRIRFNEMGIDEAEILRSKFQKKGYEYSYETESICDAIITTPLGNIWTIDKCYCTLRDGLKMFDSKQIEAIGALSFFEILYNVDMYNSKGLKKRLIIS